MKETPIIMQAESIRAILSDPPRKTQTRRLMSPQPAHLQEHSWNGKLIYEGENRTWCWKAHTFDNLWNEYIREADRARLATLCPYGAPGSKLWIKEAWSTARSFNNKTPTQIAKMATDVGYDRAFGPVRYADGTDNRMIQDFGGEWGPTRSSLFMPRWASRLTIELTEVRAQKLQEITAADACDEGALDILDSNHPLRAECYAKHGTWTGDERQDIDGPFAGAIAAFATLWDAINGSRRRREYMKPGDPAYTLDRPWRTVVDASARWDANPWCWALSFRRVS